MSPSLYGSAVYGVGVYSSASATGVKHRMAKIALNIARLSVNAKIAKGRTGLTGAGSTDGAPVLGVPIPAEVPDLLLKTDALETARDLKLSTALAATNAVTGEAAAEVAFNEAYAAYGRIGQTKTGGDPVKIGFIGMDVAATAAPVGPLPATAIFATMSEIFGSIDLMCEPVEGAHFYIWQRCSDPLLEANWQQIEITTATKFTVPGLTSGTKYWFRVAAKGTGAQGPWSDPAQKMAP